MKIAGQEFERGVGTHAISKFMLNMDGKGVSFKAYVGIDDEFEIPIASVTFYVLGDKKILWESGKMTANDSAKLVNVDISGIQKLALLVTDAGEPYILTLPAPETPRINGAKITGVSPDKLFIFKVPVTGNRPMTIKANNLPDGLLINEESGLITGC